MSDDYQAAGGVDGGTFGWGWEGGGWMAFVKVFGSKGGGSFFLDKAFKHMRHVTYFVFVCVCVLVWSFSFSTHGKQVSQ